jgi:hypothetical protein
MHGHVHGGAMEENADYDGEEAGKMINTEIQNLSSIAPGNICNRILH